MKFDLHVHSIYSPDSITSVEKLCERYVQLGFAGFALTDHRTFAGVMRAQAYAREKKLPVEVVGGCEFLSDRGEVGQQGRGLLHRDIGPAELAVMAARFNNFDLVGLEINASCPNTGDDLLKNTDKIIESCEVVKAKTRFPIILKLSVVHDVHSIVREVTGLVGAFSINSVPWSVVFPGKRSPFAKLGGGGVSGKVAQPFTWRLLKQLVEMTDIPVIGPSVWDFEDIAALRALGAQAIAFGAVFLRYPWRPTRFIRRDKKDRR